MSVSLFVTISRENYITDHHETVHVMFFEVLEVDRHKILLIEKNRVKASISRNLFKIMNFHTLLLML